MKEILQSTSQTTELKLLKQLNNKYFAARFIEIGCVLDVLLNRGALQKNNLTSNSIIDLGTGSGIGLLALRRFTNTHLIGVDDSMGIDGGVIFSDYNEYAGRYKIPTTELINQAQASFVKQDIITYLEKLPNNSTSLITAFYMSRKGWAELGPEIYDQLGRVLTPDGQFLLTSDADLIMPKIDWGKASIPLRGNEGSSNCTLIFNIPGKIPEKYQDLIQFAGWFLEDETLYIKGKKVGLIRDRNIQILTKN